MKSFLSIVLLLHISYSFSQAQEAPKPFGAVPSERQLKWHETEQYGLIHFTPTTYENKEWGYGDANPSILIQ